MSKRLKSLIAQRGCKCHWCGCETHYHEPGPEEATVEHMIPKSKGGGNDRSNLRVACKWCNVKRGNKTQEEWLQELIELAKSKDKCILERKVKHQKGEIYKLRMQNQALKDRKPPKKALIPFST